MAMDVDEAGYGHHPLAVDGRVDRPGVARSDMGDLVVLEYEIGLLEIDVPPFGLVPRNDVVEAGDLGRSHSSIPLESFVLPLPLQPSAASPV